MHAAIDHNTADALVRHLRHAIRQTETADDARTDHIDWNAWEAAATSHHVDTILAVHPPAILPAEARARLQTLRRQTAQYNLHLMARFGAVAARLDADGIPYVVFKGPVAAVDAFGALEARSFVDIDILVAPVQLTDAANILRSCGFFPQHALGPKAFRRYIATFRQMPYEHADHPLIIEIHTAPMPAYVPMHDYDPGLVARARSMSIGGVNVRAVSPEDHLLLLCMHGTKEGWPHLRSVADIAGLLSRHPHLDLSHVHTMAKRVHAGRALAVGLSLADWMMGAQAIGRADTRAICARVVRRLSSHRHGSTNTHEITVVLPSLDRTRDRARFVTHHASGFTLADYDKWPAGDHMLALTRVTRPLRLTAKYVGKLLRRGGRRSEDHA
jgi:hypothetical protein